MSSAEISIKDISKGKAKFCPFQQTNLDSHTALCRAVPVTKNSENNEGTSVNIVSASVMGCVCENRDGERGIIH